MEEKSLLEALISLSESDICPMHMPGHKRTPGLPEQLPYAIDITEIDGFDDLHDAGGILKEGMERAAHLWGADRTFYLVGGSTCGLLAGIRAAVPRGSRVLVGRNCHKAVYHALELCALRPAYLQPEWDQSFGLCGSITPQSLALALQQYPDTRLVVLTSPTYEGVLSDVAALAALCHEKKIPLLVDEAHGAHLGFDEDFPRGAVAAGADLVVQSLHKTLPALTQTGLLHLNGNLVDAQRVARELNVFETSSPSYPLMASIDGCVRILEANAKPLFQNYADCLRVLSQDLAQLTALRVLGKGLDGGHAAFYSVDPGKIVVSTLGTGLTGVQLADRLRREYHIEPEMAAQHGVILMTSLCDSEENFARLDEALLNLDAELTGGAFLPPPQPPLPLQHLTPADALERDCESLPPKAAVGRISAQYLWAYPPGIPLLVPGEEIAPDLPERLDEMRRASLHLVASSGNTEALCCLTAEC